MTTSEAGGVGGHHCGAGEMASWEEAGGRSSIPAPVYSLTRHTFSLSSFKARPTEGGNTHFSSVVNGLIKIIIKTDELRRVIVVFYQ